MPVKPLWDIFCRVVDNFGDVGVCWRLGRQLADAHGIGVRLWCDDLAALARLVPGVDPTLRQQSVNDISIRLWAADASIDDCADVVIEAFACELPLAYQSAMARRQRPPLWINLEYLSAEAWVAGCHCRSSPHPRLPLLKHFFFPGFTADTGGLLREADLLQRRDRLQREPGELWARIGLPTPRDRELSIFLFCYPNPALPQLLDAWATSAQPVRLLVPEGHSLAQISDILPGGSQHPGKTRHLGKLTIHALPFVAQTDFDDLLWACDVNFVRGEDSFVRAQWAARPFVWHIYPQDDAAHAFKLAAFLDRYRVGLPAETAAVLRSFWEGWNHGGDTNWGDFLRHKDVLEEHSRRWADQLATQFDLAENLVKFVESHL